MPKLYFGSRGGLYYRKKGRKVYVTNRFGNDSRRSSVGSGDDPTTDMYNKNLSNTKELMKNYPSMKEFYCATHQNQRRTIGNNIVMK